MSGVVKRSEFIFETEILKSGAGLDDISSAVLDAALCNTSFSGVPFRYIIPEGSVMVYVNGDSAKRVAPLFMCDGTGSMHAKVGSGGSNAYVAADIAGILSRTVELVVGDEVLPTGTGAPSQHSDTDVSLFHHGCHFKISKLVGYNPAVDLGATVAAVNHGIDNSAIIKSALYTCLFD